jgi:hypothetical protein
MTNFTNRFTAAAAAITPLLLPLAIAALLPEKAEASTNVPTCQVTQVDISISSRSATIHCQGDRVIKRAIIAGNPKAPKLADRTPIGRYLVTEVVDSTEVPTGNYMAGAAKFAVEKKRPEIGYYIHGMLPNATGYQARYSIGCIRMNMAGLRYSIGSVVVVTK